ncbi:MAG: helix-turn-helix domain-containing protein [Breznakia sp.]
MQAKEALVHEKSFYYLYNPSAKAKELYFFPTSVGHFFYEAGYSLTRTNVHSYLLCYIVQGEFYLKNNNIKKIAHKGEILLIDCFVAHEYGCDQECEVLWLHYDGPLAKKYYDVLHAQFRHIINMNNSDSIHFCLQKILGVFQSDKPIEDAQLSKYIVLILTDLIMNKHATHTNKAVNGLAIRNSVSYINENFHTSISLKKLAKRASLSPYHYTRCFAHEIGTTPHQYLIDTRIKAAKFMLKTTSLTIKEIAYASGFQSETSFCNTFKKKEKITPTHYRRIGSLR